MTLNLPHHKTIIFLLTTVLHFTLTNRAQAELTLHPLFTDHAVLQQGQPVPVWGTAEAGDKIQLSFAGQQKNTTTQADGTWMLTLAPLPASATPRNLTISSDKHNLTIQDILIGEVWLCAGQSNMARSMSGMVDKKDVIEDTKAGKFKNIRLFKVPLLGKNQSQTSVDTSWTPCSEESVNGFSGTGFYFGRALHRDLKVPVGLIHANWGGTNASCWISKNTLENDPTAAYLLSAFKASLARYPKAKKAYDQALAEWEQKAQAAKQAGQDFEEKAPREPMGLEHPKQPAGFYNGMIAPLQPYTIAGVIWSQGESNATNTTTASNYKKLMLALISGWRSDWVKKVSSGKQRNFPFYQVQLPNFSDGHPEAWPIIREQMLQIWQQGENTGMVVTIDIGNPDDIHPQNKRIVGDRLSRFAQANAYGKKIPYSGPIYQNMQVHESNITLTFTHLDGGLICKDGQSLRHFTIAGQDKKFVPAQAHIVNDTLIASSPQIKKPRAVRYAWSNNPENPNFFNQAGLPASPFRTDSWPTFTRKK